jgi:hypothetical protein
MKRSTEHKTKRSAINSKFTSTHIAETGSTGAKRRASDGVRAASKSEGGVRGAQ